VATEGYGPRACRFVCVAHAEVAYARGIERGLVEVQLHNIRDWAHDKHHTVDDRPFGGGPGMVLKVEPVVEVSNSPGSLIIKLEGEGHTLQIGKDVFQLSQNSAVLEAVEGTLAPINDHQEAKAIEFRKDNKPIATYRSEDAKAIAASCEDPLGVDFIEEEEEEPKVVTAVLYSHDPVFDVKAPNWRFLYRKKPIYADIKETNIAKDAVKRGGSFMNDRYKVKMEVSPPNDDHFETHYKIIEVLEFTPAEQQINMRLRARKKSAKKRAVSK
jgi:hypothetical protein